MPPQRLQGAPTVVVRADTRTTLHYVRRARFTGDDHAPLTITLTHWRPGDVTFDSWQPYWLPSGPSVR